VAFWFLTSSSFTTCFTFGTCCASFSTFDAGPGTEHCPSTLPLLYSRRIGRRDSSCARQALLRGSCRCRHSIRSQPSWPFPRRSPDVLRSHLLRLRRLLVPWLPTLHVLCRHPSERFRSELQRSYRDPGLRAHPSTRRHLGHDEHYS